MRIFELLLLLSNAGLLAIMIFFKNGNRRLLLFTASGISAILAIVHGLLEGPNQKYPEVKFATSLFTEKKKKALRESWKNHFFNSRKEPLR